MDASYVDLADPMHLEFAYLRWMRIALRVAGAHRVLHVGGGACALARALVAEDPGGCQLVCEIERACSRSRASIWGCVASLGYRSATPRGAPVSRASLIRAGTQW